MRTAANRSGVSDSEFISLFESIGPSDMARKLGVTERAIFFRRNRLEARGPLLTAPSGVRPQQYSHRLEHVVRDGCVIIGSDGHFWPGEESTAFRAMVELSRELKPRLMVFNGDALDGARISRHASIAWEQKPFLVDEIDCVKERMSALEKVTPKGSRRIWTLGNHDARFETHLANKVPEYAKVHGVHLKDHFPRWECGWSLWINNEVVVKHRLKGGTHATHNNAVSSGKTVVTGHLHSLKVTPVNDYNGVRWGVDTGCLADTDHEAFVDYTEDAPLNWRSGFAVLTFKDGDLLWPEVVHVVEPGKVTFRGKVFSV